MKPSPANSQPPAADALSLAHWSGPLPPPATLEQYERLMPGAAQKLMDMAEAEQRHRHALESGQLALQQEGVRLAAHDSRLGIFASLAGLLFSIGAGLAAFIPGADWRIVIALCGPAIMMVLAEIARRGKG